jgi:hypothetical protein
MVLTIREAELLFGMRQNIAGRVAIGDQNCLAADRKPNILNQLILEG